jgi:inorganic pyrophosphatase/exopolyphosphatase
MATVNPTTQHTAKALGQRLLIDTAKMTVRRMTKSETSIMNALKSLAPVERATLSTVVDALQAKKRSRSGFSAAMGAAAQTSQD